MRNKCHKRLMPCVANVMRSKRHEQLMPCVANVMSDKRHEWLRSASTNAAVTTVLPSQKVAPRALPRRRIAPTPRVRHVRVCMVSAHLIGASQVRPQITRTQGAMVCVFDAHQSDTLCFWGWCRFGAGLLQVWWPTYSGPKKDAKSAWGGLIVPRFV
jgi:hypothetical protein